MSIRDINRSAFTVTEILIALGVIAILTTILMPIIHELIPDQNALMAKRAFYTAETVVQGLLNDTGCYPPTRVRNGFGDGQGYRRCSGYPNGSENSPAEKFRTLFTDKLDLDGEVSTDGNVSVFTTKDGMDWRMTVNADGSSTITIDVNGEATRPNCGQSANSGACTGDDEGRQKGFDKFTFNIAQNGQMEIEDCWAILAVRTDKKLIGHQDVDESICNGEWNPAGENVGEDPGNPENPENQNNECNANYIPTGPDDNCCNIGTYNTEYQYRCNTCYPMNISKTSTCCNTYKGDDWKSYLTEEIKTACCTLTHDDYFCSVPDSCYVLKLANVSETCCNFWKNHPELFNLDTSYLTACENANDQECILDRQLDTWGTNNPCNFEIPVAFSISAVDVTSYGHTYRMQRITNLGGAYLPSNKQNNDTITGDIYGATETTCSSKGAHIITPQDLANIYYCVHYNKCGRHPSGYFNPNPSSGGSTFMINLPQGSNTSGVAYNWGGDNLHAEILGTNIGLGILDTRGGQRYIAVSPPKNSNYINTCEKSSPTPKELDWLWCGSQEGNDLEGVPRSGSVAKNAPIYYYCIKYNE